MGVLDPVQDLSPVLQILFDGIDDILQIFFLVVLKISGQGLASRQLLQAYFCSVGVSSSIEACIWASSSGIRAGSERA